MRTREFLNGQYFEGPSGALVNRNVLLTSGEPWSPLNIHQGKVIVETRDTIVRPGLSSLGRIPLYVELAGKWEAARLTHTPAPSMDNRSTGPKRNITFTNY